MATAPLYKRYVPPKSTTGELPAEVASKCPPSAPDPEPERKRKRERGQDEVAERKAKKLRKKGVDPTEAIFQAQKDVLEAPNDELREDAEISTIPEAVETIRSGKKRHKLEREARKAWKLYEKAAQTPLTASQPGQASPPLHDGETDEHAKQQAVEQAENESLPEHNGAKRIETAEAEDIHPKKSKKEKKRKGDRKVDEEESAGAGATSRENSKEKKSREEIKSEIPQVDTSQESLDHTTVEQPHRDDEPQSKPKKRRHKLEKVIDEAQAEGTEDKHEHDDRQSKHASVLDRFQKSLRKSASTPQPEPAEEKPIDESKIAYELTLPEKAATPELQPESAALPPWLANPTYISSESKATFEQLGLREATTSQLRDLGYADALPVQQALVPSLLPPGLPGSIAFPGTESVLSDFAVSAPTGSGKTIAYLLPIIEALREHPAPGRLSALVVVPTRELVQQVAGVARSLAEGSDLSIGTISGTGRFKEEQSKLIRRGSRYDPAGYMTFMHRANRRINPPSPHTGDLDEANELKDSRDFDDYLTEFALEDAKESQRIDDAVQGLPHLVPTYASAVDLLVATPGRLLEHIASTLGFNLVHLRWLVIDEADKLLDNQYEGFLDSLNEELERPRSAEEQDARERFLRKQGTYDDLRRVRKVVLSATMTSDISKLVLLKLSRPRLIVVRGSEAVDAVPITTNAESNAVKETAHGFELPRTLVEYCVPVGDGSEKPLVALEVLSRFLGRKHVDDEDTRAGANDLSSDIDSEDDSDSSSESEESSILSSSSEDSDSSSEESSDNASQNNDEDNSASATPTDEPIPLHPLATPKKQSLATQPTILIFTSTTESAARLTHLLCHLQQTWSSFITCVTKTSRSLRLRSSAFEPAIIIATDRAARGLDSFGARPITHVLQYDVPREVTGYVHRVGRTARAGRAGQAWTLYTHREAKWFVGEICKSGEGAGNGAGDKRILRAGEVVREKVFMEDETVRERFATVLAEMRDVVFGGSGGKK